MATESSNRNPMSSLYKMLHQTREYYPVIFIFSLTVGILTLSIPFSVQSMLNTFSLGPNIKPLFVLSFLLLGLLLLLGLSQSIQYMTVEYLQRKLYGKLTSSIARSLILRRQASGPFVSLANRYFDIITVQKSLSLLVTDGAGIVFQTLAGVILISVYHPFFIIYGMVVLASLFFTMRFFYHHCRTTALEESGKKYAVSDFLESLAIEKPTPARLEESFKLVDEQIGEYLRARANHFSLLFRQNLILVGLFAVLNSLLLALGGFLVLNNQLSVGQLVAAEIVINAILAHFLIAKKHLEAFYDLYAASRKLEAFDDIGRVTLSELAKPVSQSITRLVDANENQFHSNFKSVRSIRTPIATNRFIRRFAMATTGTLILVALVPWQQSSRGEGRITALDPNDRVQTIAATVSGRIQKWLVQDGQLVKAGDPIVQIVDNDPNFLDRLQNERNAAVAKFEAARAASDTARLNYDRQRELVKDGLSSPKEFEQAKINLHNYQIDESNAAASLAQAEVKLSREKLQVVTAPQDGQILRILHGSGWVLVKTGDPIATFVPSTASRAVELFIDGNDLPLVTPDRHVRLQFEGWPSIQFSGFPSVAVGSFGGRVVAVDPQVSEDGRFRALIVPDTEDDEPWPEQTFLRQGSRVVGLVILDEVSLGYEIWRQINGFPKSMPRPPGSASAPSGKSSGASPKGGT